MSPAVVVRGGYGVFLVAAPDRALRVLSGRPSTGGTRAVVRVLGLRQVAQAVVTAAVPEPVVWKVGAAVDVAHGLSAVGLAVAEPGWRRAGITVSLVAGAFAVSGMAAASGAGAGR